MSDYHFLYLIGIPGAGKSTLIREMVEDQDFFTSKTPIAHICYDTLPDMTIELGARREEFSGTDALSLSVQPRAVEFIESLPSPLMFAEGDRLANGAFFDKVRESYDLTVVHLNSGEALAEQRRELRAIALNKDPQDPTWVKGRISKVYRLVEGYDAIDVAGIDDLRALDHPVVSAFIQNERSAAA